MITLEQAKALRVGQYIYSLRSYNKRAQPHKAKVNGQVKTWKRDPSRVSVPWKHGLYVYGTLTEHDLEDWALTEEEALAARA